MTKKCTGGWVASAIKAPADSMRRCWGRGFMLQFRLLWLCSHRGILTNRASRKGHGSRNLSRLGGNLVYVSSVISGHLLDLYEPHFLIGTWGS